MKLKTTKSLWGMLAVLAFSACSSNSEEGSDQQFWTVTLQASMDDATSRALSEGTGNAINASFAVNDEVVVVDADGSTIVGTLQADAAGVNTTLKGNLNAASLGVSEVVTLRYRSATATYDGQAGTLAGISAGQDYAEGTLTVSTISPLTFTSDNVTLRAKQSITKFSFTNGTNPVNVQTFGIAATGLVQSITKNATETVGPVTGTLTSASADVYVALRNNSGAKQTYSFMVKGGDGHWYTGTKKANLENGKNYTASVTLTQLPALTNSDAVGTIGVVGNLPAIVVNFSGTKKAVALMNVGALCPEAYGTYYPFTALPSLSDGWYVPSWDELKALRDISPKAWGTQNGVDGYLFTIGGHTLFLPAAGFNDIYYSQGMSNVSTLGCYWSSQSYNDDMSYVLRFNSTGINTYSDYKVNALSVRPFHAL